VWRTLSDAARGRFDTDVVAMLAIVAAVILPQPVAGLNSLIAPTAGAVLQEAIDVTVILNALRTLR
jgi:cation transport ATPase